jgi:hypothetical protein
VDFSSLSSAIKDKVGELYSLLDELADDIQTNHDDSWIAALSMSDSIEGKYLTVWNSLEPVDGNMKDIFDFSDVCFLNKICNMNCRLTEGFSFSCLTSQEGPIVSPLQIFLSQDSNADAFIYTVNGPGSSQITFYYLKDRNAIAESILSSSSKSALFTTSSSAQQGEALVLNTLASKNQAATSTYRSVQTESSYEGVLAKYFSTLNSSTLMWRSTDGMNQTGAQTWESLWSHKVISSIEVLAEAYKFDESSLLESLETQDAYQVVSMIAIFAVNAGILLG